MGERLGDGLVRVGAMTAEQVQQVLAAQKAGDGRPFGEIAIALGFVKTETIKHYLESVKGGPH